MKESVKVLNHIYPYAKLFCVGYMCPEASGRDNSILTSSLVSKSRKALCKAHGKSVSVLFSLVNP